MTPLNPNDLFFRISPRDSGVFVFFVSRKTWKPVTQDIPIAGVPEVLESSELPEVTGPQTFIMKSPLSVEDTRSLMQSAGWTLLTQAALKDEQTKSNFAENNPPAWTEPKPTLSYKVGSSAGTQLSRTHNVVITLSADTPRIVNMEQDDGPWAHLGPEWITPMPKEHAGKLSLRVELPNGHGGNNNIVVHSSIASTALGIFLNATVTPTLLEALWEQWWDIRDALLKDAMSEHKDHQNRVEIALKTAEQHFVQDKLVIAQGRHRNSTCEIAGQGGVVRQAKTWPNTIRPIPAAQMHSASSFQKHMQDAITDAENNLDGYGRPAGWTVWGVVESLAQILDKPFPK